MRFLPYILFFLALGYSQENSGKLKYEYIENDYLKAISFIEDVELISLSTTDMSLYGRRFFVYIREYENGRSVKEDSLGLICKEERIPILVGNDTTFYTINICDKISFLKPLDNFKIIFAGKRGQDSLNLVINYPSLRILRKLKGDKTYSLRPYLTDPNNMLNIPLNKKFPILLYTPPYKISAGVKYYCITDNKPPDLLYTEYNIPHFYLILLAIK